MATLSELLRSGDSNAVVSDIYRNVLGREADSGSAGWQSWIDQNNPNSALDLARRISQSEEGKAYAKGNQGQYNYLAGLSQENNPLQNDSYSKMEYVGPAFSTGDTENVGHQFKDQNGGIFTVDAAGNPIKYAPGVSWYDEQLAKNPNALRGTDYRNQTYLAGGPLDKTYNFNGKDIPIEAAEYQIDPKTGKFITDQNGNYKPVEWRPQGYNMWDDWAAPVAVVAAPALMAYAAPYVAGEAALTAAPAAEGVGDVWAGYSATGSAAGTAGSTVPAGYGAAASAAGTISQALPYTEAFDAANMAGNGYNSATIAQNLVGSGVDEFIANDIASMAANGLTPEAIQQALQYGYSAKELAPLGLESLQAALPAASSGLSAMQKAMLLRQGIGALNQITGGTGGGGYSTIGGGSSGGGGNGMVAYQRQAPFLSTQQQNTVPDSSMEALAKMLRG